MVKTSWIYTLRKDELSSYLGQFNINSEGTVEELRKRFITFHQKATIQEQQRLNDLALKYTAAASTNEESGAGQSTSNPENTQKVKEPVDDEESDTEYSIAEDIQIFKEVTPAPQLIKMDVKEPEVEAQLCDKMNSTPIDKIRKWAVKFDGGKGPLPFVERVEELAEAYNIPLDLLPRAMPELLKDKALTWYRSNNKRWKSWVQFKEDFLKFFLPARYFENLEDPIRQRLQQPRESFRDFVLALQELMRHSIYTDEQKLHRIYRNSRQEYQLHIKRREFETLDELMLLAGDYEALKQPDMSNNSRPAVERSRLYQADISISPAKDNNSRIDTRNACRRCGQLGHFSRGCRNQQRLFCWTCGKLNTLTRDCCGVTSGNANETHVGRGLVSRQPQPTFPAQQDNLVTPSAASS